MRLFSYRLRKVVLVIEDEPIDLDELPERIALYDDEGNPIDLSTNTPSGPAGGVLNGTYPNPGFASDMATQAELNTEASTRASADTALDTRVDTLETSGVAPSGAAGGVLNGTYPNPGFAADMATQAELNTEATTRSTDDSTLAALIMDETNDRSTADAALDTRIDSLELGSGIPPRDTEVHTTASLATDAVETSTLNIAPSIRIFKVSTSRAARVRVYATAAHRTADAARAVGTDPIGDHGLLFELITETGLLSFTLSPAVDISSDDGSGDLFVSVTNLGSTGTVATTYDYLQTE